MIVCHCRVVSDRTVEQAISSGAASLASVCRTTGAGQDCGGCVFSLKRLVCEHGSALVPARSPLVPSAGLLSEVDVAAS